MGRSIRVTILALLVLSLTQNVISESAVNLSDTIFLNESDLGLEGATISPDGKVVIGFGAESSIFAIDSVNPLNNSKLDWDEEGAFLDGDFHPGGRTALIVGSGGKVVRLDMSNFSLDRAEGGFYFGQTDLLSVSWNGDGSWAYIGGEEGFIWRARWLEEGAEIHQMEETGASDVNSIDCLNQWNICIVVTNLDGIGVITSDHQIHWLGGVGYPWIGITCPSMNDDACVAVSSDKNVALIELDPYNPSNSGIEVVNLPEVGGQFNGVGFQAEGRSIITVSPFSMIEHSIVIGNSYPWLENSDAVNFDAELANGRLVATWPTSENSGWAITSFGGVVQYMPKETVDDPEGILGIWLIVVVIGGALLLAVSALASSSTTLSGWITGRIGNEEEKKRENRKRRKKSK